MAIPVYPTSGREKPSLGPNECNLASKHTCIVDPQVKPSRPKRKFNKAYKKRILDALNLCPTPQERSSFLRREGLYYSVICAWRKQLNDAPSKDMKNKNSRRHDSIVQENTQLKKKLARAEAIIELQKSEV